MFLLWYRFPRITCNDRYCFYRGRFVTCISLSLYRKSSFGFGIFNSLLTFCRRGMTISFYFDILLRFLIIIGTISLMYITTHVLINCMYILTTLSLIDVVNLIISLSIQIFILIAYKICKYKHLYYAICIIRYLFSSLPL